MPFPKKYADETERQREKKRRYRARLVEKLDQPKQKSRRQSHAGPKPIEREFIAIDGEADQARDGRSIYTLLAASDGSYRANREKGLDSKTCLDFILEIADKHPGAILCAFGFNFDVNMILRDLPRNALEDLWYKGNCQWHHEEGYSNGQFYSLSYRPSKWFVVVLKEWRTVKKMDGREVREPVSVRSGRIYDTFGFTQKSFVNSLLGWKVITPIDQRFRLLSRMKKARGRFSKFPLAKIKTYNALECELLCEMMHKVDTALKTAGIELKMWHGSGAVAQAIMTKQHVEAHNQLSAPQEVWEAILAAYYGGRTQVTLMGEFGKETPVYSYDLHSAYPSAARALPSLTGGHWRKITGYQPGLPWALWRVRWNVSNKTRVCPLPFRHERRIYWSKDGAGWYWSCEVDAAMRYFADSIEVSEGYVFEPASEVKPFGFIDELYATRQHFEQAGDLAQLVIKFGLNAIFGKTSQGLSIYGKHLTRSRFQNYMWAGLMTAQTRARLLEAAMYAPKKIIFFATDGIFSLSRLPLEIGEGLGQWKEGEIRDFFILKPGLYQGSNNAGEPFEKTQGFAPGEIDLGELRQLWKKDNRHLQIKVPIKRFITLGNAVLTKRWSKWGYWIKEPKTLTAETLREFIATEGGRSKKGYYFPVVHMTFPGQESEPYQPKGANQTKDLYDLLDLEEQMGQPDLIV